MTKFYEKQWRIKALLKCQELDALLLRRASNFAWATCGAASQVSIADCYGKSQLFITKNKRFLITDSIEVPASFKRKSSPTRGQVYSWNPSIIGTRSEDTIIVTDQGCQVLAEIKDCPTIPIEIYGQTFLRPAILQRT